MRLTYAPDGADPRTWVVKLNKLPSSDAIDLERVTGSTWSQYKRDLDNGSVRAMQALLWLHLRRDAPNLEVDQVVFCDDDYRVELDDDQVRTYLDYLLGLPDDEQAERADAIAECRDRLGIVDGGDASGEAAGSGSDSTPTG